MKYLPYNSPVRLGFMDNKSYGMVIIDCITEYSCCLDNVSWNEISNPYTHIYDGFTHFIAVDDDCAFIICFRKQDIIEL